MSLNEVDEINVYPNKDGSFEVNMHYSEKNIYGEMHSSVATFHHMYLSLELTGGIGYNQNIKFTLEGC